MKIAFRVDGGTDIGKGHISRCLAIAEDVRKKGLAICYFVMRKHKGHFSSEVEEKGFKVVNLELEYEPDYVNGNYEEWVGGNIEDDAKFCAAILKELNFSECDWFIIDHYGLSKSYELNFSDCKYKICVIDDLATREHKCDLLIDQTCGRIAEDYVELVSCNAVIFTGEHYCMLRPEFFFYREFALNKRAEFKKIDTVFMNFGSTDPLDITTKVLIDIEHYCSVNGISIVIMIGSSCPHIRKIQLHANSSKANITVIVDSNDVAKLMCDADIAIGAAGATTWERCALGLPSIIVKTAENQNDVITKIVNYNAAIYHDLNKTDQSLELIKAIKKMEADYIVLSLNASALVDGRGLNRVSRQLINQK